MGGQAPALTARENPTTTPEEELYQTLDPLPQGSHFDTRRNLVRSRHHIQNSANNTQLWGGVLAERSCASQGLGAVRGHPPEPGVTGPRQPHQSRTVVALLD